MNPFDFLKRLFGGTRNDDAPAPGGLTLGELARLEAAKRRPASGARLVDRRRSERVNASPGLRVLIIDDSATIVAVLGRMLRQNGFVTAGAGDAESGIEFARAEKPGLIFLDIVLPGMSGFNALRHLRRDPETHDIPIVMISGNVQATEQFYVQRIGADDFMKKPFGRGDVFSRIQKLVESGRLPDHAAPSAELLTNDGEIALPDPAEMQAMAAVEGEAPAT